MVLITNFGDVTTTGNMTVNNSLTVQGDFRSYNIFSLGTSTIGNVASPFSQVFVTTLTAATANVANIYGPRGRVGVGTTDPGGAALFVQGNVFVSNSIQTTNLFVTTLNAAVINSFYIVAQSGSLGIGTTNPQGANLYVQGNVVVSNSIRFANIFLTTINATSINTASLFVTNMGVGAPPGRANLYVQGNVYISGNLVAQTIYYGEDIFKRGPYLQPSPANADAIQAWISATANASSQPTKSWWASSATPTFGAVGFIDPGFFSGSLLLPDGRIFFTPYQGTTVSFFNPSTGLGSSVPVNFQTNSIFGAALAPNGNVVLAPAYRASNVVVFNPLTYVSSNIDTGCVRLAFNGCVLSPTGNVILCPRTSGNIGLVNPVTLTYTNIGPIPDPTSRFSSAVLLPNGNVFFANRLNAGNSAMYNTSCLATVSSGTTLGGNFTNIFTGTDSFYSAFLAPNGNVICTGQSNIVSVNPRTFIYSNTTAGYAVSSGAMLPTGNLICSPGQWPRAIGMFDTVNLTFSTIPGTISSITSPMYATTLYPDGRVFLATSSIYCLNTMVPVDPAWCLGPYFNKV